MKASKLLAATAALLFVVCDAQAQPAAAAASGPMASSPAGGMAGRGGMGGRHGMGGRWGAGVTPGWSMMSSQERSEHQAKMRSMTNYADCKSYVDQHHGQMVDRAAEKGLTAPAVPRRDACAGLKR